MSLPISARVDVLLDMNSWSTAAHLPKCLLWALVLVLVVNQPFIARWPAGVPAVWGSSRPVALQPAEPAGLAEACDSLHRLPVCPHLHGVPVGQAPPPGDSPSTSSALPGDPPPLIRPLVQLQSIH